MELSAKVGLLGTAAVGLGCWAAAAKAKRMCPMWPGGATHPNPIITAGANIVLVGATDGIGLALALEYYAAKLAAASEMPRQVGADGPSVGPAVGVLVLVGRKPLPELTALHSGNEQAAALFASCAAMATDAGRGPPFVTRYLQADLATEGCGAELAGLLPDVEYDLLVNLASCGKVGPMPAETEASVRLTIATNVTGAALVAKHVLAKMGLKRVQGIAKSKKVVFVSSVVAPLPRPVYAGYVASKAAVDMLCWSLQSELDGTNIAVQSLHPGATKTRFFEKVGVPGMPTAGFAEPGAVAKAMVRDIACSADLSRVYGTTAEQAKFLAGSVLPLCFAGPLTAGNLCIEMLRSLRRRLIPASDGLDQVKHVVVTGAGRGLGSSLVGRLLKTTSASVTAYDRAFETDGPCSDDRVSQVVVDLSAPGLTDKLLSPGGGLEGRPVDLLICNAGVNFTGRLTATEDIQIVRTMEINLASVLVLTNIVNNHNAGLGAPLPSVVLISSLSHYFSYPGGAIYGASKEGLVSLAKSLRAMGATVLAVFPGPMRTQMAWDAAPSNDEERVLARMDPDDAAAAILKHVKRRDVAAVVASPGIVGFSRKAVHDPAWAEALMANWQLKPLIAKQEHDRPGSSGF